MATDTAWIERVAVTNTLTDLRTRVEGLTKVARTLPASKEIADYGDGLRDGLKVAHLLLDNTIRGFAKEDEVCPECEGTNINWDFAECRDCKGGPND